VSATEAEPVDTEWRDLDGMPVVSERIVSIFIPSR
jgi:hypothetical protein